MAKKTLAELKAAFSNSNQNQSSNNFGETYPFWQMADGEQAIIRFLPDGNDDNPLSFLLEKLMHRLEVNGKRRSVPCLKMYGEECPICDLSAEYYNNQDKINGKRYWRNKQHIARALIIKDPLPIEDGQESHEGKIRTIPLSWQVFEAINGAFEDGELEELPHEYEGGYNFIIKKKINKTADGDQASYVRSRFENKQTDISDYINIEEIELADFSTYLPQNPGIAKTTALLEADVTGETLDEGNNSNSNPVKIAEKPQGMTEGIKNLKSKPKVEKKEEPTSTETKSDDDLDSEADAILAEIMGG